MTSTLSIGWIGTGVMGRSMCGHLLDAGHRIAVHTRTRERATELVERGARWCESPAQAAKDADAVFTMVGFPEDVRAVYFGEQGVLGALRSGHAPLIDMPTTRPALAIEIARAAEEAGCSALDAPVSGGDVGARNATLSIMIGGETAAVERARPLLERLGKNLVHQGPAGSGQHTKLCNQIAIAGTMIGVCESLLYARRSGLDPVNVLRSIGAGAAACWTLDQLAPRMLRGDFAPGFLVDHFVKDMGLALEEAARMRLAMPGLSLVHQLYVALQAQGGGRDGTHGLLRALERISGE
jgi:3-hydroxyisobutyrate dehydrogenase